MIKKKIQNLLSEMLKKSMYETEDKIVLIEKSLLIFSSFPFGSNILNMDNFTRKAGLYNNAADRLYLTTGSKILEDRQPNSENYYLDKYSQFATYYSYTYKKNKDSN